MPSSKKPPLLISTDFDGTLIMDYDADVLAPGFFDRLKKLCETRRVVWVINTGRDWESLAELLRQQKAPLFPDWVVLVEREIYRLQNRKRVALDHWNNRCGQVHENLFHHAGPLLGKLRRSLLVFKNLSVIEDIGTPFGLIAESEQQADEIQEVLIPLLEEFPEIHTMRNSIYFRFAHVDFHKGSCLAAIAEVEKIPVQNCFAIGDHFNDLPMLSPRYAAHLACPVNSVPAVKTRIQSHGGFVSDLEGPDGVCQALDHFFGRELK